MGAFNVFRLAGDLCHVVSFLMLIWQLHQSRSAAGGWRVRGGAGVARG